MTDLVYCPTCNGPAERVTDWRGDVVTICRAYQPCQPARERIEDHQARLLDAPTREAA